MSERRQGVDWTASDPAQDAEAVIMPVAVIRRSSGWAPIKLADLWSYRELFYFLAWRDIKVRYKQTALGAAWAIIQPFLTMIVFTIFFGHLAHVSSDGAPYPIFAYSALLPWMYFANAVLQAGNSLVEHERLITKVYFPRLIIPVAAVLAGLVDFVIAFTVLIAMMFFYGVKPTAVLLTVPFFVLLAVATAIGIGLWLSALNVQYRDVKYAIPFLIQFWLFLTPVVYSSSIVPGPWRGIYNLNPMVGVIGGFRWAVLATAQSPGPLLAVSVFSVLLLLIGGFYYFERMEKTFADVV
jgi:lipopolysaccharide transport system permease protein